MNKFLAFFLLTVALAAATRHVPSSQPIEPLADPRQLRALLSGKSLNKPMEEAYGEFHGLRARSPALSSLTETSRILGLTTTDGEKRIEVDLTNQKVYAFEGETKVYEFLVSTGKWAPTPTGQFSIWAKVRSQKMEGGDPSRHTYYYLPNVPYVMFFANDEIAKMRGFSLHGAYWHNNFGHPMSHGCINMKIEDAHTLYDWANPPVTNPKAWSTLPTKDNPGTRVVIYGETPRE